MAAGANPSGSMTQAARITFLTLVAATFGAFFLAQRLKNESPVVSETTRGPVVSANGDGRSDSVRFSFRVRDADTIDVTVVNRDGDTVRTVATGQEVVKGQLMRYVWDGKDDAGHTVPDGTYRPRVVLRDQGRSLTYTSSIRSDTTPTKPKVLSISPSKSPTAEYLPTADGKPATIRIQPQGKRPRVSIWRTDTPVPERVATSGTTLGTMSTSWDWPGTVGGKPAPEGIYVAVLESRDSAGNIGSSIPVVGPDRHPALEFGRRLPGRAGISVRYLAVQSPGLVIGGQEAKFLVDARGRSYRWTLRRVGAAKTISRSTAPSREPALTVTAPDATGVYLLKVKAGKHVQRVPLVVQQSVPVGRVLVVLPAIRWQGRNRVDDDGDGRANTLAAGVGVRLDRPASGTGLPQGFADEEAPLLTYLDRTNRRYDLTTDVALLRGTGPKLDEFGGIVLPGDEPWLTGPLGAELRKAVQAGGTLVSFGTDSLRRQVTLDGKRLIDPTAPADADLFGARLESAGSDLAKGSLTVKQDRVDLFQGTAGTFPDVGAREETLGLSGGSEVVASAVTESDRAVIVAASFGQGVVIRTGLPDLAQRLVSRAGTDSPYAALVDRTWVLASRGRSQR